MRPEWTRYVHRLVRILRSREQGRTRGHLVVRQLGRRRLELSQAKPHLNNGAENQHSAYHHMDPDVHVHALEHAHHHLIHIHKAHHILYPHHQLFLVLVLVKLFGSSYVRRLQHWCRRRARAGYRCFGPGSC